MTFRAVHDAFNPHAGNGGRFHWFYDRTGTKVPILYAASNYAGAIAETVFHDIPLTGRRTLLRRRYRGRTITKLRLDPSAILDLVQFHDPGLLRLRVRPRQLTETTSYHYERTARWAQAVYDQLEHAQGIVWRSGRFNTARAVVLFGNRVPPTALQVVPDSVEPIDSGAGLRRLLALARSVNITVARTHP
jgi:RES domain-containing protein